MVASSWREILFAVLVAAYVGLSYVAWTDHPREPGPVLTDLERRGLDLWRRHNCQVCHQIHGFGGFLGPDLTNAIDETRNRVELAHLLWDGYGKMPAFHLEDKDARAVLAFLSAVNETGRSQPRPNAARRPVRPEAHWKLLFEKGGALEPARDDVMRGCEVMTRSSCGACHIPFMAGTRRAPDLTTAAVDRSPDRLVPLLKTGRGNMPAYTLTAEEVADLGAFLEWTARNRKRLVAMNDEMLQREGFSWRDLTWWEYP